MKDIRCPFCQQEMLLSSLRDGDEEHQMWYCLSCKLSAQEKVWQELIRTRKALEIAVDALKKIGSGNVIEHSVVGHENGNKIFIANKAIEQITALEQKK